MSVTASQIATAVQSGETSAHAVMVAALERIAAYDAVQPQAWISRFPDAALVEAARAIDARVASGETLPLAGVPYAVKDNIDVAGLPTTAACPGFAYAPERSAEVVARLEAAGAICIGKTNLDQFATGLVGTRSPYGAPGCVYNLDYISGGSSSGSGVVVAAGLVPFALGTDTAGSGRVPAALNGCIGLKPSKGRWSSRGLLPACRSLDCISVFTADVADARLVDALVAGFDPADPFSRDLPPRSLTGDAPVFGIPLAAQLEFHGDAQSAELFEGALVRCRAMGATIVDVDIAPLLEAAKLLYSGPWVAERAAAVGAFIEQRPDAVHPVVAAIIKSGWRYSGVDTFQGIYTLQQLIRETAALFADCDALLLPTCPTIYTRERLHEEPYALNSRMGLYTAAINLLDLAAIALPAGYRHDHTGFGISLIGPAFSDVALIDLGERLMAVAPNVPPPLDLAHREDHVKLAVVGAHLEGMPLHWELTTRDARLLARTKTAAAYKLYAIADSVPPKPALVHVGLGGSAIEIEVYELSLTHFGSFVANVPPPLAIGTLTLESGEAVKGFIAEPRAITGAEDITSFGGWRGYMEQRG
jgi:allophanate hydrolase